MTRRWISALLLTALALALVRASAGLAAEQIHRSPGGARAALDAAIPAGTPHPVSRPAERSDSFCLTCHADPSLTARAASGRIVSMYVDSRVLRDSAHPRLECVACHRGLDRHPEQPAASGVVDMTVADVLLCESCHLAASNGYGESVHGAPVLTGTGAGATCIDCHASDGIGHATAPVADVPADRLAESIAENCGRCHKNAFGTYRTTAHSQLVRFGDGARAATCSSCHGAHAIVAAGSGALTPARLAPVCQQCHDGADATFAEAWRGHEASASPAGLAEGLHKGVVALMALCLAFGLAHTTVDFVRNPRRPWGGSR